MVSTIGGADGPTAIFLAGQTGFGWINLFGIIIIGILLIPNIVYAFRFHEENLCTSRAANILEQIGRYGCMLLMIVRIGGGFAFASIGDFLLYLIGSAVLLLLYWVIWLLFFIRQDDWKRLALAIIPTLLFLL